MPDEERRREHGFKALVENSPDLIMRFDRRLRFRYLNPAAERASGVPCQGWLGKTSRQIGLPREAASRWEVVLRRVFASGKEEAVEFSLPTAGGPRFFDARIVPEFGRGRLVESALAIARDITERKRAEETLRRSEECLRSALSAADTGTWRYDLGSGLETRDANTNRILGLDPVESTQPPEESLGRIHPDDRTAVCEVFERACDGGRSFEVEFRVVDPDGTIRWLRSRGRLSGGQGGRPGSLIGAMVDVTALKRVEEQRARLLEDNLRQREFLERLVEEVPAGIAVLEGPEHRHVLANPVYHREIARGKGQVLGRSVAEVWPELPEAVVLLDHLYRTGEVYHAVDRPLRVVREGGPEETYISLSLLPLRGAGERTQGILVLAQETTRQVRARKRAEALASVVMQLNADRGLPEVLRTVLTSVTKLVGGDDGALYLFEEDGRHLRGAFELEPCRRVGTISDIEDWPSDKRAADAKKPVYYTVPEVTGGELEWFRERNAWGCLSAPLLAGNRCLGLIFVHFREVGHTMSPDDIAFVETVAGQCALAIDRARAYEQRAQLLAREREARAAAERQAAQMSAILENLREGVNVLDTGGNVLFRNRMSREITGVREAAEPLAGVFEEFRLLSLDGTPVPPEQRPVTKLLKGEPFADREFILERADGTRRRILSSGTVLRDAEGRISLAIITTHDVTELRRLEHLKDEFLQVLAHELRNPLAAALGLVQLVLQKLGEAGDKRYVEHLRLVKSELDRLNGLITDIIQGYRVSGGRLTLDLRPINLGAVVREATRPYALKQTSHKFIVAPPPAREIPVMGDARRLVEVLANLLSNAVKYSPTGGRIWVGTALEEGNVLVRVEDEGIGIPPDQLEKVFEGFYRATNLTSRQPGGLGLGLYVSRDIARRHGGDLWAENRPGGGTAMCLKLPLARPPEGDDRRGP